MTVAPLHPGEVPTTVRAGFADGACRTIDELFTMLPLTRRQISDGAASLIMRGQLERIETGCYQLTPAGLTAHAAGEAITSGPTGKHTGRSRRPLKNTLRQRAWTAMRMSGTFTIGDLVMAAAREERDAETNIARYLRSLKATAYVLELPVRSRGTHLTSNGFKRFRLIKDTGPIAPVWSRARNRLVDHNGEQP